MRFSGELEKVVKAMKGVFCPNCKHVLIGKDCPFFEMCVVSLFSLKKKKPIHFVPSK